MKKIMAMVFMCVFLTGCGENVQEETASPAVQEDTEQENTKETEETGEKKEDNKMETEEQEEETEEKEEKNGGGAEEETENEEVSREDEAQDWETLASESYEYEDGTVMTLLFSLDRNGASHITIGLETEEKWKAAYLYTMLDETIQLEAMQELNPRIVMTCGSDVITSYGLSYDLSESGKMLDQANWLAEGLTEEEMDADEADELTGEIMDDLIAFMSNS